MHDAILQYLVDRQWQNSNSKQLQNEGMLKFSYKTATGIMLEIWVMFCPNKVQDYFAENKTWRNAYIFIKWLYDIGENDNFNGHWKNILLISIQICMFKWGELLPLPVHTGNYHVSKTNMFP